MTLMIRSLFPQNVFELMGKDENSATYALGWTLEKCPHFSKNFIEEISDVKLNLIETKFSLQKGGLDKGFTDLEISCGSEFRAIIEAKNGFELPTTGQLMRYRPRLNVAAAKVQKIVTVSALPRRIANLKQKSEIDGIPLLHISWGNIRGIAKKAKAEANSLEEKLWLRELIQHTEEYAAMNTSRDNMVYVVSLGSGVMHSGTNRTWIDVVEQDGCYFHQVGNHWPSQPPNYIGFRYRGELQSVHRIESYEIFTDISTVNPSWCPTDVDHFVYKLGPAMRPPKRLGAGGNDDTIRRSARVWCAIDTLLSGQFEQLGQARDETSRRKSEAENLNE